MTETAPVPRPVDNNRFARTTAALIALSVVIAFAIDVSIGAGSPGENAAGMLRFFTIWGGVGSAIIMARTAMGKAVGPAIMAALATAVTVIGLVYWTMLAGDHHPQGIGRISNQIFHTLVPVSVIAWWLRYTPAVPSILPQLPVIMVPPLAYGAFAFVLGEMTGFYAYFFIDLPKLGWFQFVISNILLACFFAAMGTALLKAKAVLFRLG